MEVFYCKNMTETPQPLKIIETPSKPIVKRGDVQCLAPIKPNNGEHVLGNLGEPISELGQYQNDYYVLLRRLGVRPPDAHTNTNRIFESTSNQSEQPIQASGKERRRMIRRIEKELKKINSAYTYNKTTPEEEKIAREAEKTELKAPILERLNKLRDEEIADRQKRKIEIERSKSTSTISQQVYSIVSGFTEIIKPDGQTYANPEPVRTELEENVVFERTR